ncbi:MAG TPA: HAD family hydrolase [Candidatus Gallacutalibacter pullistercoris]|nr:HAD family hydrolase [Candidatus Gallacutalibacter pullistercoris]
MKYQHIVFDVDGTLVCTEESILRSLRQMLLDVRGEAPEENELRFCLGITGIDALKVLNFAELEHPMEIWVKYLSEYSVTDHLFDGIAEVLEELRKSGTALGIVTSRAKSEFQDDFQRYGIAGYFTEIICADDTQQHKPSPEPLLEYLKRTGGRAEETLYIGDSPYDSRCAAGAGVDFALAGWGTSDLTIPAKYRLSKPEEIFMAVR